MKDTKLEAAFTAALLETCRKAELTTGLRDPRFVGEIEQRGGAEAMHGLLKRHRLSPWFEALAKKGQLAASPEALTVQSKYGELFTDDEVNECFSALLEEGWML